MHLQPQTGDFTAFAGELDGVVRRFGTVALLNDSARMILVHEQGGVVGFAAIENERFPGGWLMESLQPCLTGLRQFWCFCFEGFVE